MTLSIRRELPHDRDQTRTVNEAAFGRSDEADLIDNLRVEGMVLLSLVAELDDRIVGHILFSRMTIGTSQGAIPAVSLAPMAVLPDHQGRDPIPRGIRFVIVLPNNLPTVSWGMSLAP
jgi:putative acetyltransferase